MTWKTKFSKSLVSFAYQGLCSFKSDFLLTTRQKFYKESPPLKPIMEVTREMIAHVAGLARLNLTHEEIEKFTPQLKEVIEAFSQLAAENTTGVKPSFHPIELKNALREDSVKECISQEQALRNAKHKKDGYFKGPKAV